MLNRVKHEKKFITSELDHVQKRPVPEHHIKTFNTTVTAIPITVFSCSQAKSAVRNIFCHSYKKMLSFYQRNKNASLFLYCSQLSFCSCSSIKAYFCTD